MSLAYLLYSPVELACAVGNNAKLLRLSKNMSRKTLAERSGVSESSIKRFEQTGSITLEAMILLAVALDEMEQISLLFKPANPKSHEELKNAKRKRGTK